MRFRSFFPQGLVLLCCAIVWLRGKSCIQGPGTHFFWKILSGSQISQWVTTKINEKYNNSAINMNLSLKTPQKLNSGLFFSLSGQKIAPENFQKIF